MFEYTRVTKRGGGGPGLSDYKPAEVVDEPSNYGQTGSSVTHWAWQSWKPLYLWEQMMDSDTHIEPWNILDPVFWRIVDLDKRQYVALQDVYGKPLNFQPPQAAQLNPAQLKA